VIEMSCSSICWRSAVFSKEVPGNGFQAAENRQFPFPLVEVLC